MFLWMLLSLATASVAGFLITRFVPIQFLVATLIGAVLLPVAAYSLWFVSAPAGGENALGWWMAGLVILFVPMVFWLLGIIVGYRFGRQRG